MKRFLPTLSASASVALVTLASAVAVAQLPNTDTKATIQTKNEAKAKLQPDPDDGKTPPVKIYKSAPKPKAMPIPVAKKVAVQKGAAMAAVRIMPAAPFNQGGQVQQMMMQFRPILRAEFHVIRAACNPTPEQRKAIARAAEQTLRDATKKYLEAMQRPMNMNQRAANDPRKYIQDGLLQAIKAQLPPDKVARYQDELTKRAAGRKRLALRNLVARLDHDLVLSPDQREKLGNSLSTHWDESWGQSLEMFLYDNNYFPPIADQYVTPFLNASQNKIWKSTQKFNGFFGGFGMVGGIMDNDPLEDEELREARLAAAKNAPEEAKPAFQVMPMMKIQVQKKAVEAAPKKK